MSNKKITCLNLYYNVLYGLTQSDGRSFIGLHSLLTKPIAKHIQLELFNLYYHVYLQHIHIIE